MLRNYLIVAKRHAVRNGAFTLINVIGLAIGLTCGMLILLYIENELSYNHHHSRADRIHKVFFSKNETNGNVTYLYGTPGPLAPILAQEIPEVEDATRFMNRSIYVSVDGSEGLDSKIIVTDDRFLSVFDFPLIEGDPENGLSTPFSAFVTQSFARRLFGDDSSIGRSVSVRSKFFDERYTITGILEDIPATSIPELSPDLVTTTQPK
jgi:putative ABC transport system permease protein